MATFRADDVLGRSVELIDAVVQVLQEGHVGGEHPSTTFGLIAVSEPSRVTTRDSKMTTK